ncbi:YopX family protein [Enterococcus entomosocium]|uniref:YopX family protein n=1 Tax=Enterococcus entomosocium TaxID=3034352 RepID=UPI003D6B724A
MVPKFRCWFKDSGTQAAHMVEWDKLKEFVGLGRLFDDSKKSTLFILMQSTGLKDKNGVEVFQGDVVVHEEGEYSYKGIVLKDKYYFYIEGVNINDSFSFDDISNTLIGEADLEVIGNIYENPELLEQADES